MAYDVVVIGTGPGGYVAAIRASQLGLKTAVIEKESLGGICLNWGCIPTKALLKSAQVNEYINHSKDFGIEASGKVDFPAVIKRSRGVADKMNRGVQFLMKKNKIDVFMGFGKLKIDGKKVVGYREAMILPQQPKSLIVVGSGAIGIEFAYFYKAMGTKVTVVEFLPRIVPVEDEDISKELEKIFKKGGIDIMTS